MKKVTSAKNEVIFGSLFSYANVLLNSVYSLIILPFVIGALGQVDYGVYKTISSLSSSILILDLGLGSTCIRYISMYLSSDEEGEIPRFVGMIYKIGFIVTAVLIFACFLIYLLIPRIYQDGLTNNEIRMAQGLFMIISINIVFHMADNILDGIVSGYNKFAFTKGLKLFRVFLRASLVVVVLTVWKSPYALVLIDLAITIFMLLTELSYIKKKIGIHVRFERVDKVIFDEIMKYTLMIFVTTIINLVNNSLDNVFVGALLGADFVTVYSVGLTLFSMFNNLSTSISSVMLPTVTKIINEDPTLHKVCIYVVKIGRIQFMILGAVLVGFICVGKKFIYLWMGSGYEDVYCITLILMIPAMFELVVNVCLSVLRAKNMLGFRTIVLLCTTGVNAAITYYGLKTRGYFYAAIGTATSCIIGSILSVNIYYYKKFAFNMLRIYKNIFSRTWVCVALASIVLLIYSMNTQLTWPSFAIAITLYLASYFILLFAFGFNNEERSGVKRLIARGKLNT